MEWLTDPENWLALVTLTVLEIVLGIDNIIFISILVGKLPDRQQPRARQLGLFLAMFLRIGLLASLAWMVKLTAPLFTVLGQDIKRRSPFRYTYVAELANDWIGYLPDREAHDLGGYQTWTGLHSYAEIGTGERMADEAVEMLKELARSR